MIPLLILLVTLPTLPPLPTGSTSTTESPATSIGLTLPSLPEVTTTLEVTLPEVTLTVPTLPEISLPEVSVSVGPPKEPTKTQERPLEASTTVGTTSALEKPEPIQPGLIVAVGASAGTLLALLALGIALRNRPG